MEVCWPELEGRVLEWARVTVTDGRRRYLEEYLGRGAGICTVYGLRGARRVPVRQVRVVVRAELRDREKIQREMYS